MSFIDHSVERNESLIRIIPTNTNIELIVTKFITKDISSIISEYSILTPQELDNIISSLIKYKTNYTNNYLEKYLSTLDEIKIDDIHGLVQFNNKLLQIEEIFGHN